MTTEVDPAVWSTLRERIEGEVILPGEARMVLANKHFMAGRPLSPPQALIRCRNRDDVRHALECVRAQRIAFSVRSGGHCFADLSSSGGVIIDLAEIAFCHRDGDLVSVGPGLCGGQLAPALARAGLAFPTGGCPWVAMGGLSLVGGFGHLGRRFGLATDRVRALEVVTAEGDLIPCDAGNHSELFWALRGAGAAGLGIVTALSLAPEPFPEFRICYGEWPISEAIALLSLWQAHFANPGDPRIALEAELLGPDESDEACKATLFGLLIGEASETAALIATVREALGPLADALHVWIPERAHAAGYLCGLIDHQGEQAWQPSRPYERSGYQFTRSDFFDGEIPDAALAECVRHFMANRGHTQYRELEFIPWGGAYARTDTGASFAHRSARSMLRHTVMLGASADSQRRDEAAAWVDGSRAACAAFANGSVYQGYADWRLNDWAHAYHGATYPRLQAIKARYDAGEIFRHAQSIRLPDGA